MIVKIFSKVAPPKVVHKISHVAHHVEHPFHLVYFGMLVTHMDYKMAAAGCLIVGVLALLPGGE